jgi:hypothetical protein
VQDEDLLEDAVGPSVTLPSSRGDSFPGHEADVQSRGSVTSSPDGMRRVTGSAATVPANTTTVPLCMLIEGK